MEDTRRTRRCDPRLHRDLAQHPQTTQRPGHAYTQRIREPTPPTRDRRLIPDRQLHKTRVRSQPPPLPVRLTHVSPCPPPLHRSPNPRKHSRDHTPNQRICLNYLTRDNANKLTSTLLGAQPTNRHLSHSKPEAEPSATADICCRPSLPSAAGERPHSPDWPACRSSRAGLRFVPCETPRFVQRQTTSPPVVPAALALQD
jgi:hypothetical protein